ncbi:MAG TPA: type II toxin-antitoxin system VapC family toxin [Anaerolineales bacterium]|nr:type II toxin-antitoxin system VapC family toxin [Anaerolineales bacterium]
MILYLDASALVKRYIQEKESEQVSSWIDAAEIVLTGLITRVEVAAAIARAGRMKLISSEEALAALRLFRSEWESFHRLPITENTVMRGDALAYEHNLRGYDATHLACALIWQETLGMPVTLASFDGQLIEAAKEVKMAFLPRSTMD